MTENEIITQKDPQMQMFSQLLEGILKKLERYCTTARPMAGRRGLSHGRGSLQPVTYEHLHTSRLSGQQNDSLLQNRRQDTL